MFKIFQLSPLLLCACAAVSSLSAIQIELDYTYDTQGFFDQPGSREALRAVADFFEERLNDSLLEIDQDTFNSGSGLNYTWSATFRHPGNASTITLPGLVVPANTIIIFAGGENLGGATGLGGPGGYGASGNQAWFDHLDARGQSGALATPATDFGPWGGFITFNTSLSWHFQMDSRPEGTKADFVSVALHELGHVLGIGTADSWDASINEDDAFTGSQSVSSFGAPVPLDPLLGHWQDDANCSAPLGYTPGNALNVLSQTYTSFGNAHGVDQIALMDPSSCTITNVTTLLVFTDLDFAALSDIGWEVFQPLDLEVLTLEPAAAESAAVASRAAVASVPSDAKRGSTEDTSFSSRSVRFVEGCGLPVQ